MRLTLCRPVEIPRRELLRYARGGDGSALGEELEKIETALKGVWEPKAAAVLLPLGREGEELYLGTLALPGRSIARHLAGCNSCWLLGLTLGFGVDRAISAAGQLSPARALLLDAAATAAVEDLADAACETLTREGTPLTGRFSAGYGDLPLDLQGPLLELLRGRQDLGLSVGPSLLLSPVKSVTALLGRKE